MSTTYNIDFSEPTKAGFQIKSGAYNGPGGANADTTLRLFGRGAREWGEAVDEDLVRLTENFAAASAPSVAISGQLWIEVSLYYRDTTVSDPLGGWYRFNTTTKTWALIGGTGIVSAAAQPTPTVGHYYAAAGVLRGYYSLGKYEPAAYLIRSSSTGSGAPTTTPGQTLYVFDANANSGAGQWVPQSATAVTNGPIPSSPRIGMLWYNTATGNLSVWSGTTWQNTVGPTVAGGQSTSSGVLNMNTFRIINLATPTTGTDATTKQYVDTAIAAVSGNLGNYLPITGGTLTGPGNLTVNGTTNLKNSTVTGTLVVTSQLSAQGGLVVANGLNVTGAATVSNGINVTSGGLNVSGNIQMNGAGIFNMNMSGDGLGATNKNYVDSLYNQSINYTNNAVSNRLTSVAVSGPYLNGNGTGGSPVAANIAAIKSAIFSSLTCADVMAIRNQMINCGIWIGGGQTGGIGAGGS